MRVKSKLFSEYHSILTRDYKYILAQIICNFTGGSINIERETKNHVTVTGRGGRFTSGSFLIPLIRHVLRSCLYLLLTPLRSCLYYT